MPRGVTRVAGREELLQAGQRLLEAAGPSAMTVRGIANEAGVATGLLYSYFDDRDGLLVALVVEGFRAQAKQGEELIRRADQTPVHTNLTWYGETVVQPSTRALAGLMFARPDLAGRVRASLGQRDTPGLDQMEHTVRAYLEQEQEHGRIKLGAKTASAATLLVGGWHRLLTSDATTDADHISDMIHVVLTGLASHLDADIPTATITDRGGGAAA